ncbi:hypothetical protein LTR17_022376 [Elasticomyces elasticus]|nr:hypothetical protein LTR17_022376 [Elasticomyces elasticus]
MSRLEKFLDEAEIKSLLVRERYYRDMQQWENMRQCYHSDAAKTSINITWYHGDVDGFVAGCEQMAARKSASSSHTVCPVVVAIDGDRAVSESMGTILARFRYEERSYDCSSYGRFVSRLERSAGEWKMLTLEVIYDRDSIQSVTPGGSDVDIEVDPKARKATGASPGSWRRMGSLLIRPCQGPINPVLGKTF